ncbi:MAG: phosphonate metabolism protein PhnP [Advenella sp.]
MKLTFLGTGNSAQMPVYNCDCIACARARHDLRYGRLPCSALLQTDDGQWLIDSGLMDLSTRFAPGALQGIFQTHYHADHAQGLLHLRWGVNLRIAVYGPPDENGFADLYKHPGILDFSQPFHAFEERRFAGFTMTALPLEHSKLTYGYLIRPDRGDSLAYLTDTQGLSAAVQDFLRTLRPVHCVLDCSYPPLPKPGRNHNDLNQALAIHAAIGAGTTWLTHAGHELDRYLMSHPDALPAGVRQAFDGDCIEL